MSAVRSAGERITRGWLIVDYNQSPNLAEALWRARIVDEERLNGVAYNGSVKRFRTVAVVTANDEGNPRRSLVTRRGLLRRSMLG